MKKFSTLFLTLLCCLVSISPASAQSGRVKDAPATPSPDANTTADTKSAALKDTRDAKQLYDEVQNYAQKKFDDFEKRKMPFDARLEDKIKQEQRDLAARYAVILAARKPQGNDVYYLGMLYNLARNYDAASEMMRRFLTENSKATGEAAQNARAVIVIQAAKKNPLAEAGSRLAGYAKNHPQVAEEFSVRNR